MFKIYKIIMQEYCNVFSGRLVEEVRYKSEGQGSISVGVFNIFHLLKFAVLSAALWSTKPLTNMRKRGLPWG
jgi:hypothetical protein